MSELILDRIFNPAAAWYRGDFHAHTDRSDGRYTAVEVANLALKQGLDFFAITDHNTLNSFDQFGDDSGLLVIPGVEVTLDIGHWNVFGMQGTPISAWQAWMEGICGDRMSVSLPQECTTSSVMDDIAAGGLLNSINHPFLKPWDWRDPATALASVHFMEVWNDHRWPDNHQATIVALDYWTRLLNAGIRLTAIGGSDFHFLPGDHRRWPGEYMGMPTTWVYAEQLSGRAVLEGLRRGRAYISIGPQVALQARCAGETAVIGDSLEAAQGEVQLIADVEDLEGDGSLHLVRDGILVDRLDVSQGTAHHETRFSPEVSQRAARLETRYSLAAGEAHWFRLEVYNAQGELLALTNPIFTGPRLDPAAGKFGEY